MRGLVWHSSSEQRSWPVPRRAGDLAARSLQSQSDLYSRSRSRGEIATVSARSRAASALINSRHRLAHRLRHRHTGARGDTGRGRRRGPRRRDGRRRRRLNGARRVLDETHSFFMRRLSADYLGGTSCQRVRCPKPSAHWCCCLQRLITWLKHARLPADRVSKPPPDLVPVR